MKKLFVLALILGLASIASASLLGLDVLASEITVGGVTTVEIVVTTTYGAFGAEDWVIDVSAEAALGVGIPNAAEITAGGVLVNNGTAAPFGHPTGQWGVTMDPAGGVLAATDILFSFTLTGVSVGTATITLYDLSGGMAVADTETVDVVVPEPMTMALLGLGGLFLRRRRQA